LADETKTVNNTPTAEDYQALKTELEAERKKTATQVAEATKGLQAKVTSLEAEVGAKTQDIEAMKGQLVEASTNFEGAKAAYAYAVEDFKRLAAASNPLIPQEAIYGTTIEEIKASMGRANKLVANVQESLSKQAQAASVPAGAPARTEPSTEGLSTKEKINLGLEKARKKKEQ
jgi:ABC-type transporter Mla subunit MlaD